MRQISRKAAVYAAATTMVLATASTGFAATGFLEPAPVAKAQSAKAGFVGGDAFFVKFDAKRAKGVPETRATGTFTGQAKVAGNRVLQFAGPVTCLNVTGTSVGLFYPVTKSDPAAVAAFGAGVFIYVDTDGKGNATRMSFLPAPTTRTDGCAPVPGLVPAKGKAVVTGG